MVPRIWLKYLEEVIIFCEYGSKKQRKISGIGFTNERKSVTLLYVFKANRSPHCRGAILSCADITIYL